MFSYTEKIYIEQGKQVENNECDFCFDKKYTIIYFGASRYLSLCSGCSKFINQRDRFKLSSKRELDTFLNNKKDEMVEKRKTNPDFVEMEKIKRHERHCRDQKKKWEKKIIDIGSSYTKEEWEAIDQAVIDIGKKTDSEVYSR